MEKRARSRFSYRKIVVPSPKPEEGMQIFRQLLTIPLDGLQGTGEYAGLKSFNRKTAEVLSSEGAKAALARFFRCNVDMCSVEHLALDLICRMGIRNSTLTVFMLREACESLSVTSFQKQVLQMPIIDLTMLVAMQRLEIKSKKAYNFNHVYEEYQQMFALFGNNSTGLNFGKEAALESYMRLIDQKFVMLSDNRRCVQLEYKMGCLLMMGMDLEATIQRHPRCPEALRHCLGRKNVHTI